MRSYSVATARSNYFAVAARLHDLIGSSAHDLRMPFASREFGPDRVPALVCALRSARATMGGCGALGDLAEIQRAILTDIGRVIAIQRIRLDSEGRKVKRMTLGPMGVDGVVFLSSIWNAFYGIGDAPVVTIAEGIETALAMRAMGFPGCVALAGAGRFRSFELPPHWGEIIISGENDGGPSESGWRAAGPHWARQWRNVDVWVPDEPHKDANDHWRARALKGGRP